MKTLQLTAWKHEPELREVADPEPGPGEVVVRIGGAGACHSDLHLMHDFEGGQLPWGPPFTLGHENAGWVHAIGDGVRGVTVGEPVAVYGPWGCGRCRTCLLGMENYCERQAEIGAAGGGLGLDGGMAPLMLVPNARWLVPLGDLDPVQAAPLTDAGLTPYHAIKRSLPLLVPGATALVIGAGGLGHMAVQILEHLCPASVIVVDQRPQALELAAGLGAEHTVVAGGSAADEIRDLTAGRGADVVIDVVGADDTLALGAAVVRPMGHLTIVGIAGGTLPIGFFSIAYEASVATTYWGTLPELFEVIALASAGHIKAHVTTFGLDDALDAYRAMREGTLEGRAVNVPGTPGT
jgi:propanol-preferring alcohol dehydrogenase